MLCVDLIVYSRDDLSIHSITKFPAVTMTVTVRRESQLMVFGALQSSVYMSEFIVQDTNTSSPTLLFDAGNDYRTLISSQVDKINI